MKMKIRPLEWEQMQRHYLASRRSYACRVWRFDGETLWRWDALIGSDLLGHDTAPSRPEAQAAAEACYQRAISAHLEPDTDAPGILPGDPGGDDTETLWLVHVEGCKLVYDERKNVDGDWEVEATITGVQLSASCWINRAMAMAINADEVLETERNAALHRRDAKIDEEPRK